MSDQDNNDNRNQPPALPLASVIGVPQAKNYQNLPRVVVQREKVLVSSPVSTNRRLQNVEHESLSPKELKILDARKLLSSDEDEAFERFCNGREPVLQPLDQENIFKLFLEGKTLKEIKELNRAFSFEQVVHACIIGEWHKKKKEHTERLLRGVIDRVQITQLESINYICDMISVTHKMHTTQAAKYLQSGNPEDLKGLPVGTANQYKQHLEILRVLTGQDGKSKGTGQFAPPQEQLEQIDSSTQVDQQIQGDQIGPISSDKADKMLEMLEIIKDEALKKD